MKRRLALALFAALVPAAAGAAERCPSPTPPPSASGPALAAALAEINRLRARAGVPALTLNARLTTAAQCHAEDMAAKKYFSHDSKDGRTFVDRVEAAGYRSWTSLGENIASGQQSWRAAIQSWYNSPGHRANMLSRNFKDIGLGAKSRYWVQDFGSSRSAATATSSTPAGKAAATTGEIGQPASVTAR